MLGDYEVTVNVRFEVDQWAKLKELVNLDSRTSLNWEVLKAVNAYLADEVSKMDQVARAEFQAKWSTLMESHTGDGLNGPIAPVHWKKGRDHAGPKRSK